MESKRPIVAFCAIIVLALIVTTSLAADRKVNLRGNWKFSLGDNMNFAKPGYDDSKWEEMYVPANWHEEGFSEYRGYAWYRYKFEISFKADEPLFIELGRIDDVDEVYINGHLVGTTGGFPSGYYTAFNVNRSYLIPTEYLVQGKGNVVAVRVFDEGGEGGILGKYPGIYSYSEPISNSSRKTISTALLLPTVLRETSDCCRSTSMGMITGFGRPLFPFNRAS